jgi:hypothetical protein
MPTASAQPMSLPDVFQPGSSLQARHFSPIVMPIPTDELASEKAWRSKTGLSPGISWERVGRVRRFSHHVRSSTRSLGGCRGIKGRSWKVPIIFSRLVK